MVRPIPEKRHESDLDLISPITLSRNWDMVTLTLTSRWAVITDSDTDRYRDHRRFWFTFCGI